MDYSMGISFQQEQRAGLAMTFQLSQAIHLLQYSTMDLYQYVYQQLSENPLLEINEHTAYRSPMKLGHNLPVQEQKKTLREACKEQLRGLHLNRTKRFLCNNIIDNLDENGYLYVDSTEVCRLFKLSRTEWERCLRIVQSLEPIGIGARSLGECLRIQLEEREAPQLAITIVERFLKEVASGKWRKIAEALRVSLSKVEECITYIQCCNPRPGSSYSTEKTHYIYPDVMIHKVEGVYVVVLNEGIVPPLKINEKYKALLQERSVYGHMKSWYQSASWILRALEQRRNTIVRVVECIITKQEMFLDYGVEHLKPLTLHEIASELDIHESTVSRVTQYKYVETPRGTLPLQYFFSSGVGSSNGGRCSSTSVKQKVRKMIEKEDKKRPYSDQKMATLFQQQGIDVSRRTITKYREELGILSSRLRGGAL